MSQPEPWEQHEDETGTAYTAFVVYRDMGPRRRKTEVYRVIYDHPEVRQPPGWFMQWTYKNKWDERARAWDAEKDRVRREVLLKDVEKRQLLHIRQARAVQAKGIEVFARTDAADILPSVALKMVVEGQKLERLALGETTSRVGVDMSMEALTAQLLKNPDLARRIESATDDEIPEILDEAFGQEREEG